MRLVASALALATLGLSLVTASTVYADGYSYHGAPPSHRDRAPDNIFYGYVPGGTTTFVTMDTYRIPMAGGGRKALGPRAQLSGGEVRFCRMERKFHVAY
jgi:hypothetical protein